MFPFCRQVDATNGLRVKPDRHPRSPNSSFRFSDQTQQIKKNNKKKKRLPTAFPLKLRHDRETSNSRSPQEKTNLHMNTSHFSWDG